MENPKNAILSINTRKDLQNTRIINFLNKKSLKNRKMGFTKKYDYYEKKDFKIIQLPKSILLQENM